MQETKVMGQLAIVLILATVMACHGADTGKTAPSPASADWPAWRGDGSGASHCGAEMVDSLDKAKLAWKSDPVGLSGCMYPGGVPGEGWCDPVIADGRVFVYWFRRGGPDLVDLHALPASRGWASLIDPPDKPEAFGPGGGHRTSLPSKEMCAIQRPVRADDIVTCLDERTGKTLWQRVFHVRGINSVRVYGPLCVPCVRDGKLYALGSSGRVYALDAATGKTIWESDLGRRAEELDQIMEIAARSRHRAYDSGWLDTSVVCADGVVAVGEGGSPIGDGKTVGMVGLDAATGRRLWTVPSCLDRFGSPAVWRHDGKEYVLAAGERMVLVEPKTGKMFWTMGGPADIISGGCAPAVSGDYVVVAKNVCRAVDVGRGIARGPTCYRLDLTGAKQVWSKPYEDDPGISLVAPAIDQEHAYVNLRGGVACIELASGKEVGKRLAGFGSAYAGYAVGDGLVFQLGLKVAKGFPDLQKLDGTLPGKPDFGEIHTPAMANGRAYWRGKKSVWCYDFRKNPPSASTVVLPSVRDLSKIKDDPVQLAQVVEKEAWPTRAAAADLLRALEEKGRPASSTLQKLLLAAVVAKDWGDVDLLIDTLLAIDPAEAKPVAPELAKLLEGTDELAARLAFHALGLMGPQAAEATPALTRQLDPSKPELAALAARTLGRIGPGAQAAVPALVKCLAAKDEELTCQVAKALCHVGPADPAARDATIEAVLANPWFVRSGPKTAAPPRRTSYKAVALSLLGKDAVPQFLERANKMIAAGTVVTPKGTPRPQVNYIDICDMADAAFVIEPKSAPDFLPLLAKIPRSNPPKVGGSVLKMTEEDLKGTLDQRDPDGRVKAKTGSTKVDAKDEP